MARRSVTESMALASHSPDTIIRMLLAWLPEHTTWLKKDRDGGVGRVDRGCDGRVWRVCCGEDGGLSSCEAKCEPRRGVGCRSTSSDTTRGVGCGSISSDTARGVGCGFAAASACSRCSVMKYPLSEHGSLKHQRRPRKSSNDRTGEARGPAFVECLKASVDCLDASVGCPRATIDCPIVSDVCPDAAVDC